MKASALIVAVLATGGHLAFFGTTEAACGYFGADSLDEIYERMAEDIDIDCGGIANGKATIAGKGEEILDYLLDVASGRQSKSEALGYGGAEFVPWLIGAVM